MIRLNNLDKDKNINEIVDNILQSNVTNYKKYIENMYKDDFQINIIKRICHFPPCLQQIIGSNNYCYLHNEDSI